MNGPLDHIQIRPGTESDVEAIADFNERLALESEDKRLDSQRLRAGVAAGLRQPEYCRYYVAANGERPVGQLMITFEWSDWRDGLFWWVQSVYVEPAYRRQGIFRKLYQRAEADARSAGNVCGIRLYVEQKNGRAMATYRDMGMIPTEYLVYEADWTM